MTTSTPSSTYACSQAELPIIVEDRRRWGFFRIENAIIDQYGTQLKAHGVAVYNVLSRFANREGECFPSQTTIAQRIGMSRMQVSREIDKLKTLGLIEVKPQFGPHGEQRANLYLLCDMPKADPPVTHRYTPQAYELHPSVTGSDTPCHTPLYKQNTAKKTKTEQNPDNQAVVAFGAPRCAVSNEEPDPKQKLDPLSGSISHPVEAHAESDHAHADHYENSLSAASQASAAALIAIGLAQTVARQLVERYSPAHIAEKIEYLAYLQAKHPQQVLKPCGWLRRAIEQNYAAPDGYRSTDERAIDAIELQRHEEEAQRMAQEQLYAEEAERERRRQEAANRLTHLQTIYGTTQQELDVWQSLLQEFQRTMPATSFMLYVADTVLLSLNDGEALIGLPNAHTLDWLENRFAPKIQRTFASYLGGQKVQVKFIALNPQVYEGGLSCLRC